MSIPTNSPSVNTISWKTLCASFVYDQNGTTMLEFSDDKETLTVNIPGVDASVVFNIRNILEFSTGTLILEASKKLLVSAFSAEITATSISSKISDLYEEVKSIKRKIDTYEAEISNFKTKSDKFIVESDDIKLGSENSNNPLVLFNPLNSILSELLKALSQLTVTCSAPGSISSVPLNFSVFAQLSQRLQELKTNSIKVQ